MIIAKFSRVRSQEVQTDARRWDTNTRETAKQGAVEVELKLSSNPDDRKVVHPGGRRRHE